MKARSPGPAYLIMLHANIKTTLLKSLEVAWAYRDKATYTMYRHGINLRDADTYMYSVCTNNSHAHTYVHVHYSIATTYIIIIIIKYYHAMNEDYYVCMCNKQN